ncbi:MAG: DUF86 domain-containing protein [Anaerolineales bacterium]|nr:DUF86 domain-containing protein [Anaerolineales bacterium]
MTRDKSLIFDIHDACELILKFIEGVTFKQFEMDIMRQDAVIRRIEIIGEASNNLSDEYKEQNPEIPWFLIRGMRNRLVHDYGEVDIELVWTTCQNDIRKLKEQLEEYI